ncbi:hypothetical protein T439DRAFT_383198 [Meredithblackwellia eburnea MCA 4105]
MKNKTLPLPAVAFTPQEKRTRLQRAWSKFKRQLSGSTPSDSLGEPTTDVTSDSGGSRVNGGAVKGKTSSFMDRRRMTAEEGLEMVEGDGEVDLVVVENEENPAFWQQVGQGQGLSRKDSTTGDKEEVAQSDRSSLYESRRGPDTGRVRSLGHFLKYRMWPSMRDYFDPQYSHKETEDAYQKEMWYSYKSIYIWGAIFMVVNCVLNAALLPKPWSSFNKATTGAMQPFLSIPLVPMTIFDFPRKHVWFYQVWLWCAVWVGASAYIIDMKLCGYYEGVQNCGNRDFLATFYYASALPVAGSFALGQKRIMSLLGTLVFVGIVGGGILPHRISFIRVLMNWVFFMAFVMFFSYVRERQHRRMYTLRAELKISFRAKQRAQISERKSQDARRRFQNYIFHEVRVPLNTAMLAIQNLQASDAFHGQTEHREEYAALDSSLKMMSQVLNDVLDFSRMEKGGFSSVSRPFSLHGVMRSLATPLKLDANARGLELVTSFDPKLDEIAKRAAYGSLKDGEIVAEGDGLVIGDEMRLRQVINNLTSNSAKFTRPGGRITLSTKLIYPPTIPNVIPVPSPPIVLERKRTLLGNSAVSEHSSTTVVGSTLSPFALEDDGSKYAKGDKRQVIAVRIEVQDTGVGILPRDMEGLFSPYVQTTIGMTQGGKGTGLGLSLVKQIVSLSGGRLGVKSQVGRGTTMWLELPFHVGPSVLEAVGINWAREEQLEKELATPQTYLERPRSEYDFDPPTPPIPTPTVDQSTPPTFPVPRDPPSRPHDITPRQSFHGHQVLERSNPSSPVLIVPSSPSPMPPLLGTPESPPLVPVAANPSPAPPSRSLTSTSSSTSSIPAYSPPPPFSSPPLASSSSLSSTTKSKAGPLPFKNGPLRALIVDDDNLTRKLMGRMVERLGATIASAENGAVALELILATKDPIPESGEERLNSNWFDIILLDNQMPVCSGLEVVKQLKELGRKDFIVGCTANAQIEDQAEFITSGASVVLTKPVKETDLRKMLTIADERKSRSTATRAHVV